MTAPWTPQDRPWTSPGHDDALTLHELEDVVVTALAPGAALSRIAAGTRPTGMPPG
jgi:hypothetical protein